MVFPRFLIIRLRVISDMQYGARWSDQVQNLLIQPAAAFRDTGVA